MEVMIVDDEFIARRNLRECCEAVPDLKVIGEFRSAAAAFVSIRRRSPDLLFLDVQMEKMSGMELARQIAKSTTPIIVFVTAYDHYAQEAFEISAVDYLLKPFDDRRFTTMLTRVRLRYDAQTASERQAELTTLVAHLERAARQTSEARPRLIADSGGRMHMLDVAQIEAVEADRNYVALRVGNEILHARSTLQGAEVALRLQPMLRISRSCLVNINHVREVTRTIRGDFQLLLSGGSSVASSQGYRDKVRAHFERLMLRPE